MLSTILRNGYWIKDFLNGSPIRKHFNSIKAIQTIGITSIQDELLTDLLDYATSNTQFYNHLKGKGLSYFPIVNKQILRENFNKIKVVEYCNPWQTGNHYTFKSTSGSTGTPFTIPIDTRKQQRRIAELKFFGEIVGFKSHDKLLQLRIWDKTNHKSRCKQFFENIIPWDISDMSDIRMLEICNLINKKKIRCIRGYASSIGHLFKFALKNNIQFPTLKTVISGSETLLNDTRELISTNFNCNIISQYANQENGILAQELSINGSLIFQPNIASYFFEFLKLDSDKPANFGELARIVITDYFNFAFPMIRYDTGDVGIAQIDRNSNSVIIKEVYGRCNDIVYTCNRVPISPSAISVMMKNYQSIIEWQFIQNASDTYTLDIKTNTPIDYIDLKQKLKLITGQNSIIRINHVSSIKKTASLKRRCVINNC